MRWKSMLSAPWLLLVIGTLYLAAPASFSQHTQAAEPGPITRYDIGTPANMTHLWVDPATGSDDNNDGSSPSSPLQTLTAAWNRIPISTTLQTGFSIHLRPGSYAENAIPTYWESRHGSASAPIIIQADGGAVTMPNLNIFDTRYLYLIGFEVRGNGGDIFHCELCDHLLLRRMHIISTDREAVQETLKMNQSQYIFIEDSVIGGGANDNTIDFVSVQYGHIVGNEISDAQDWCMYSKGGSSNIRIESNRIHDCGTGGYTAGQGSGFEFMSYPWLHYEAYNIRFVNNLVYNTDGAGAGINGGYNILIAYNTFYHIGARSHVFEATFGARSCDGNIAVCQGYLTRGGWGTLSNENGEPIPNKHVYVFNNLFINLNGFHSQWQQFMIPSPRTPGVGSNIPNPAVIDDDLRLRGNLIWNGPPSMPLGIEDNAGCQSTNPTCNVTQLRTDNLINSYKLPFVAPESADFRLAATAPLTATLYDIPAFSSTDLPRFADNSTAPADTLLNSVDYDYYGNTRANGNNAPGALALINTAGLPVKRYVPLMCR